MQNWNDFYFLCGSSAAALTGLTFVAITFGSRLITKEKLEYTEAFFSPICYHFIQAFTLCCVALIPTAGPKTLALTIIASTLWRAGQLFHTVRLTRIVAHEGSEVEASDWILGIVLPALTYIGYMAAAAAYLIASPKAPSILAACLVAQLLIALRRAWEMLLWVATKVD